MNLQSAKTIKSIERLNLSVNGNPRFEIAFKDGTSAITSSDAAVNYEIGNPGYRDGDTVLVTFTRAGRIAYMNGYGQSFESDRLLFQWTASQVDPDTDSDDLDSPGRYDGATDRVLAWALDTLYGVGCADEEAGDVDTGQHCVRFGRYVLTTDNQGFVDVVIYNNADAAEETMRGVDAEVS